MCWPFLTRRLAAAAGCCAVPVWAAGPALAHAFPERLETPLPLGWYLAGAGAAVALSFLGAAGAMRGGPVVAPRRWPVVPLGPQTLQRLGSGAGLVGLALLAVLLALGWFGPQDDWQHNALPVAVWVWFWVLLLLMAGLLANPYAALNPFAALARLLGIGARPGRPLPRAWPAAALLVIFGLLELVWPNNTDPRALVLLILAYAGLTLAGMHRHGRDAWLARGEVFCVVFAQAGRIAPLGRSPDGRLELRPWGAALARGPAPDAGTAAVILILLTLVIFDGLAETMAWNRIAGAAMRPAYGWGLVDLLGFTWTAAAIKALGLGLMLALVAGLYTATCAAVARTEGHPGGETARAYAASLLPVALGYHLAHYFSYLLIEGQLIWPILSDPLGRGWDLFGWAGHSVDIRSIRMPLIWAVAVAGVVGGHVLGVLTAHRIALARSPVPARAHAPLVVLMVAVTLVSLWTLSQPIVHQ